MMRFLKWFFLTLKEWFLKPDTHPGTIIGANENLSRFIFSTRYFSRQALRVKAEAYMPKEGEVSVFRVDRLTAVQIWKIGDEIADERIGRFTHVATSKPEKSQGTDWILCQQSRHPVTQTLSVGRQMISLVRSS